MSDDVLNVLNGEKEERICLSRREMLLAGGSIVALSALLPHVSYAGDVRTKGYPRKVIGKLSALKQGEVIEFNYPDDDKVYSQCMLVKLGQKAGAGVGPAEDVVAFSSLCTHMGGLLAGSVNFDYSIAGPCPTHLSTFDLTRFGIIVSGHATESLPQVLLEIDGDDIVATGMFGLAFGREANPKGSQL